MLFKLAVKNVLSRRSSAVIVLFMSFAATLLVVSNAVFDSTEQGVQNSFTASFTGDLIIRPESDVPLSLFGDETPITGELTAIEKIVPYEQIWEELSANPDIKSMVPQVSGVAMLEAGAARKNMSLFGVPSAGYISMMDGLRVVEGGGYADGERGVMVSDTVLTELGVTVGDRVQFTIADGTSFRIRAVPITAVYSYASPNAIFERFVLVDPVTVRDVMDIADTYSFDEGDIDQENMSLLDDDLNFDDLFASASDVDAVFSDGSQDYIIDTADDIILEDAFPADSDADFTLGGEIEQSSAAVSTSWNFIVCRLADGADANRAIKKLNKEFDAQGWPVEAVNWRHAAGSTALYLYWMRQIFNVGILIVMAAGFIVVNNTLVINVLDRTREIGTMRALGASPLFVSLQCMIETLSMALVSGVVGCILGGCIAAAITSMNIVFSNEFLIQLFGSAALEVSVSVGNGLGIMVLMLCLGILGWIYPVLTALQVHPIEAIQGVK